MGIWNDSGLWRHILDLQQHGRQVRPRPATPASSAYLAHASLRIDARQHMPSQELILTGSSAPCDGRTFNDLKGGAAFMMYRTEVPSAPCLLLIPHCQPRQPLGICNAAAVGYHRLCTHRRADVRPGHH